MISEAEYAILRDRMAANAKGLVTGSIETQKPASKPKSRMNKWERAYADTLESRRQAGEIVGWRFEAARLRLADRTYFTPDFLVFESRSTFARLFGHFESVQLIPSRECLDLTDGVTFHEVKGFWRDDARVKIKVAAEMFPFAFVGVTRDRKTGEWKYEHFRGADRK